MERVLHIKQRVTISHSFVEWHYLWQSRVEIEGYSGAHFDHIAVFEAPYR